MTNQVGIWIDRSKAVIVSATADRVITRTVQSDIGGHPHYAGAQDGGGEHKYEERFSLRLNAFFDTVVSALGDPDAVLIFGPGDTKHQFKARLARGQTVPTSVVDVEAADKLTDRQIVARVRSHFGLEVARLSS